MKEISQATKKNWEKLNIVSRKMEKRANKRMSTKRIVPIELFKNPQNVNSVIHIIDYIQPYSTSRSIQNIIYNLIINHFIANNLLDKNMNSIHANVTNFIKYYHKQNIDEKLLEIKLPTDESDILGIIYQCLMTEGDKNEKGSYYTPPNIVNNMINKINLSKTQKILDPCCGTGMFLLGINSLEPKNIYGIDIDECAVMIAKANLIVKYNNIDFEPNIFQKDFIKDNATLFGDAKFDYIITNPPWGSNLDNFDKKKIPEIKSGESFSYVLLRSSKLLNPSGRLLFLLPESFLNVKLHSDIRKYLINTMSFNEITLYPNSFSGVTTNFISIDLENSLIQNPIIKMNNTKNEFFEDIIDVKKSENYVIRTNTKMDKIIFNKINKIESQNLLGSRWALGIVTGNNKEKLKTKYEYGTEPIYTGKEISDYKLLKCKNYIKYDRDSFQQVAPDEIYRSSEKLVYKFISKKITFAYDSSQSLFLNSANILIPNVKGMGIKTVMAFLNSTLFQYIYIQKFGEIKVLKGNLEKLPLPKISSKENWEIERLVDLVLDGNTSKKDEIESKIYNIYGLDAENIMYIKETVNGKINK